MAETEIATETWEIYDQDGALDQTVDAAELVINEHGLLQVYTVVDGKARRTSVYSPTGWSSIELVVDDD